MKEVYKEGRNVTSRYSPAILDIVDLQRIGIADRSREVVSCSDWLKLVISWWSRDVCLQNTTTDFTLYNSWKAILRGI